MEQTAIRVSHSDEAPIQDFHFTAYSTIMYILPGDKARSVLSGQSSVTCELPLALAATANTCTKKPKNAKQQVVLEEEASTTRAACDEAEDADDDFV